jgi:GT2 family glycosyltransferase
MTVDTTLMQRLPLRSRKINRELLAFTGTTEPVYIRPVSLLITIPVFGHHHYTHALVSDLEREGAEYLIIDNRGDYPRVSHERVITPGENLGWARGSEFGLRIAFAEGHSHAMTLNNDTRISKGFVTGLVDSRLPADAGIIGPMIDHGFPCAVDHQRVNAADFIPRPRYRAVFAVEGTALLMSRECWQAIGGLNVSVFGAYGWGIDLDLALRARKAEYGVYVTEMAYINHFGGKTAKTHFGNLRYKVGGNVVMMQGLRKLHGWRTAVAMVRELGSAHSREWSKAFPLDKQI